MGCGQGGIESLIPLFIMFAVLYFLLIRPQQKRQKTTETMLKALRVGDKVRTSSGIRGEIVDLREQEVDLLIADKVRINILRSHIAGKEEAKPSEGKGKK
ncbi:MAG: preprotein translocase subunit YajC [Deltaproteobacteria bacterium]|nr:preprotein translocase subunit YajC [Deltaproteobacteria bacterium]